jgi:rhodanese-related sulfurtransferase
MHIIFNLYNMFNLFQKVPAMSVVSVSEKMLTGNNAFIDVRSPAEYAGGHAVGAINIPLETVPAHAKKLMGHDAVYVICQSGGRSGSATKFLVDEGVNAINVSGGTSAWRSAGLPIE